jgi:GNAT superfamily N-acetyltransferase
MTHLYQSQTETLPSRPSASYDGSVAEIGFIEDRPDVVPVISEWVWAEWGYRSQGDCAADLRDSRRGGIPNRFVALRDEQPVGIVNLIECNLPPRCDLTPWLAGLFVHPEHRGADIGAALVRFCERQAAALGFPRLYLYTEDAEGFYRRLGWSTIESRPWEGEIVAVMERALLPDA